MLLYKTLFMGECQVLCIENYKGEVLNGAQLLSSFQNHTLTMS